MTESNGEAHDYDPATVEAQCRARWRDQQTFAAPSPPRPDEATYVYACTPFTTGRAHMGHVRSYTLADAYARRARSRGRDVLWAMGFDAFGLPNEVAAIDRGIRPADWVRDSCASMTEQFERLGLSVDWSRRFITSDPEYYRWTQALFLRFLERGLVERKDGVENWCDECRAVLATLQVDDEGRCWRCGGTTRLRRVDQWYLCLQRYASELEATTDMLAGWSEVAAATQRELLTPVAGIEFEVPAGEGVGLTVFCAHPDERSRATFIAISPNHPALEHLLGTGHHGVTLDAQRRRGLDRGDRTTRRIPAWLSPVSVRLAGTDRRLPVVVSPAVDLRFGSGAALGIPDCDPVDAALAEQLGLPALPHLDWTPETSRPAVRYRVRESSISRQRGWGAPVPVVHCTTCGTVPVPDDALPVVLPDDLVFAGEGSPLARHPSFADCMCPRCQEPARRDTDTLDVHMDSIWMLIPFCVPPDARDTEMLTHPDLAQWLPVEQVVCGVDQTGWWINDRFCFKVLADCGYLRHIPGHEPVRKLLMHEMVLADGRKMSKSLGNAVDPSELMKSYGADALRLSVLRVKPEKAFSWSASALEENHRFLGRLWRLVMEGPPRAASGAAPGGESLRKALRRGRAAAQAKTTAAFERNAFHLVTKEVKVLLKKLEQFVDRRRTAGGMSTEDVREVEHSLRQLLEDLAPLAPHICEALQPELRRWDQPGVDVRRYATTHVGACP
jgi:leucyl-tRNA synthetase